MKKLYELVSEIREEECILEEAELGQEEKEKMASGALEKIHAEMECEQTSSRRRGSRRKVFILAAAMISVLAFGAVAYATDLFGFGKVTYLGEKIEIASLENGNQYKALKEYHDYRNNLPKEEAKQLDKERMAASKGAMTDESYTWHYYAPDKVKELCEKYNLRCDQKDTFVSSSKEAFKKSNMGNFCGIFSEKGINKDAIFSYSDQGSVSVVIDKGDTHFDIICVPNDVFRQIRSWADPWNLVGEIEKWDFKTKSGYTAKCAMYNEGLGAEGKDIEGVYDVAILTENYVVTMNISDSVEDGKYTHSKEKLEKIIDQFDFSKLK